MEALYKLFLEAPNICTDTRKIVPDSFFVCLKGDNFDGNQFVNQALEAGAKYVITENSSFCDHPRCVVVDNCLETLQNLSLYHRKQMKIPIIGITGTNGKTTTKELIYSVLSKKYNTCCTQGNFNNHIGVPLTLLTIRPEHQIAIVEMGANHVGEIETLCNFALPNFGIITNIGKAHLEGFGSVDNIILTKKALFNAVIQQNGTLFVNHDDPVFDNLNYDKVIYYGNKFDALVKGKVLDVSPWLTIQLFGVEVTTHLTGAYNLYNILCAATIGLFFEVDKSEIIKAIASYIPCNNRSQIIEKESNTIIADYYNANSTSMTAALDSFFQINHNHKVAILGDMLELGDFSMEEHLKVVEKCKKMNLQTYLIGDCFCNLQDITFPCFRHIEDFNDYYRNNPIHNAFILVKGSRGIHLEKLLILQ